MRIVGWLLLVLSVTGMSLRTQKNIPEDKQDADSLAGHKVMLDDQHKIIPWIAPPANAYDRFLHLRWDFIKTKAPASPGPAPRSSYPQYYFYCAYKDNLEPDTWMNDVGEKIPNWFESARLYYAYTGDESVMQIVKGLVDYSLSHGLSDQSFSWPQFPYTCTNAGDTLFRGFTSAKRLVLHEVQVDHAGDIGLTYYRMYQYTGDKKYLEAAIRVANTLAAKIRTGNASRSPLPYRVVMNDGRITAAYGANWTGCYSLLNNLAAKKPGNMPAYVDACTKLKDFLLNYPMKTGYWTDGHTDTDIKSNTYKSNMSASNMTLYLFDHPGFDPNWKKDIPALIKWTEDNFVFHCAPGEPPTQWGANIVGEQDSFLYKMDYQTARYAAACARWYAVSHDEAYKEKAFRSLNWVTYCIDSAGKAFESPLSKGILSWWSDCYGEGPRMFYHVFAAIPEWAPAHENHILYSAGILKKVRYAKNSVEYTAADNEGEELLRLAFKPAAVTLNGIRVRTTLKDLGGGDYVIKIKRAKSGRVLVTGS